MVIQFLEDNRAHNEQLKSEWLENLDGTKIDQYERIYREHMDARFYVTKWCSSCVLKMVSRVWNWYNAQDIIPFEERQIIDK